MMFDDVLTLPTLVRHPPAAPEHVMAYVSAEGVSLPQTHVAFLTAANGASGYGGYFRLFGVPTDDSAFNLRRWNLLETWKFAWPDGVSDFLCFGETAWGDQYCYRRDELTRALDPPVYMLDAFMMKPRRIADSFEQFVGTEFLRECVDPYDSMDAAVRARIGDLALDDHVTYAPSPLISGHESIEHVIKMKAIEAMIGNGDLATQLGGELQSRAIRSLEVYTDEVGRLRLRVLWR